MIGLPSEERFGNVKVGQGDPPRHTMPEHENCAYYLTDNNPEDGGAAIVAMICPHGVSADGGFYSEDRVNKQRTLAQKFLGEVQSLIRNHPNPQLLLPSLEEYRKTFE